MKILSASLVVAAISLNTVSAAQGFAYAVDSTKKLWHVNLSTAASTLIGDTGITAQSLGMDSAGRLFATSSNGGLYSVNTSTAASSLVGFMGIGISASMDWDATNSRMLVGNLSTVTSIYSVNLTTGATTLVSTSPAATSIQTLVTSSTGSLLDVRRSSGLGFFGNVHSTIDTVGGGLTTVAGTFSDVSAMDRGTDGVLYGLTNFGRLISISPDDGSEVDIGLTDGGAGEIYTGMATDSVPEPATLAALGLGIALLRLRRSSKIA